MMKRAFSITAVAAVLGAVLASSPVFSKEDPAISGLDAQIRKVLENQDKILAELEEIKKELQIVKVRASLR